LVYLWPADQTVFSQGLELNNGSSSTEIPEKNMDFVWNELLTPKFFKKSVETKASSSARFMDCPGHPHLALARIG